jgi:hypothetical protein
MAESEMIIIFDEKMGKNFFILKVSCHDKIRDICSKGKEMSCLKLL